MKPDECLQHADMICLGEGEEALLELVNNLNSEGPLDLSIKNLWFNTKNGIVKNELRSLEERLDKYPFPDFDAASQYVMTETGFQTLNENHLFGEYSIITSRGCPHNCHYCYNSYRRKQYEGKGTYLRKRSIQNVIEELSYAKITFKNLERINFWDDSFVARDIEEFRLFKGLYKKHIDLPFFALIEPMIFNYEKIKLLKESGLTALQVGIQTGSEKINKFIYNRHISNAKVLHVSKQINKLRIGVIYDIIFNNPYEKEEDVIETVHLLLEFPRPFLIQGYNLIFYPGTEITSRTINDGYISPRTESFDFQTIESAKDSPIAMRGKSYLSNRFYDLNYNSEGKDYWHKVLSLFTFTHGPRCLVNYFSISKSSLKIFLLNMYIGLYRFSSKANHMLRGIRN